MPHNNARVGQLGISYPGWTTNETAFAPHPAIKALSPQATMGDVWMGDDFFHQGAFRLSYGLEYAWEMEASSDESKLPEPGRYDTYDWYRSFPTLKDLSTAVGADAWPTWRLFATHPSYDTVWSTRSIPRRLRHAPVPTLNVGGWWDQEDIYGTQNVYAAMETTDSTHQNFLVLGPWYHGEWFLEAGDSLGPVRFGSAYQPFFEALRWLPDDRVFGIRFVPPAAVVLRLGQRPVTLDSLLSNNGFFGPSADGRWIGYTNSAYTEAWIEPLPRVGRRFLAAAGSIADIQWLSGSELGVPISDGGRTRMERVTVDAGANPPVRNRGWWADAPEFRDTNGPSFAMAPGGGVIYLRGEVGRPASYLRVVPHWVDHMKQAVDEANR